MVHHVSTVHNRNAGQTIVSKSVRATTIGVLVQGSFSSLFEAAAKTVSTNGSRSRRKANLRRRLPSQNVHTPEPLPLAHCGDTVSCVRSSDILGRCMRTEDDGVGGSAAYSKSGAAASSCCQYAAAAVFARTCPLARGRNEARPRMRWRRRRQ